MPKATWDQTIKIATDAKLLTKPVDASAFRTDLATAARAGLTGDVNGATFKKGTVAVTEGGN